MNETGNIVIIEDDADIREGSMGKITPDEPGNKIEPHIQAIP